MKPPAWLKSTVLLIQLENKILINIQAQVNMS